MIVVLGNISSVKKSKKRLRGRLFGCGGGIELGGKKINLTIYDSQKCCGEFCVVWAIWDFLKKLATRGWKVDGIGDFLCRIARGKVDVFLKK